MSLKISLKPKYLLLFIFLELFTCNYFSLTLAQKPQQSNEAGTQSRQNSSLSSLKLPSRGAPQGRRRGGTSRNGCPAIDVPLTALVPGQETATGLASSNSFLASTVSEHPTFWLYIPKLPDMLRTGEFILQTETGEDLERAQIELPSTAGAMAIALSSNAQYSLATGKKYHWYFKIYCGEPTPDSDYIFVDAWIEKVALSPELEIQLQIPQKPDYLVYSNQHIWYDALTSLGKQIHTNPNNNELKTDWHNLLRTVELYHLGNYPIVKIHQL